MFIKVALYLLCTVIWGSSFVASEYQHVISPHFGLFIRYVLAAAIFGVLYIISKKKFKPLTIKQHFLVFLFGQFNFGVCELFGYYAAIYIDPAINVIVYSSKIIITPFVISLFFFRKLPRRRIIFGSATALVGVIFIVIDSVAGSKDIVWGMFFAIIAMVGSVCGDITYTVKSFNSIGSSRANFFGLLYVLPTLALQIIIDGEDINISHIDYNYVISLLYLSIFASCIAWVAYLELVRKIGTIFANTSNAFLPLSSFIITWMFYGQQFTFDIGLGIVFQIIGSLIIFLTPRMLRKKAIQQRAMLAKSTP